MRDQHGKGHGDRAPTTDAVQRQALGVGKRTLVSSIFAAPTLATGGPLQLQALQPNLAPDDGQVHAAAARGLDGPAGKLPHLDSILRAFGRHDVSGISAHVGGPAAAASQSIGAEAYATGNHVAFAGAPSLHTAAHEAAHVVQQRAGVHLKGGVGAAGDPHEQHADAVADRVVAGGSAEGLLDAYAPSSSPSPASTVQRKPDAGETDDDRSLNAIIKVVAYGPGGKVLAHEGVRAHWNGHLPITFHGTHGKAWTWSNPAARDTRLQIRPDGTGGISIEAWAKQIGANSVDVFAQAAEAVTVSKDAPADNHAPGHATKKRDAGDGSSSEARHGGAGAETGTGDHTSGRAGAGAGAETGTGTGTGTGDRTSSSTAATEERSGAHGTGEHGAKHDDHADPGGDVDELDDAAPDPAEELLLDEIDRELAVTRSPTGEGDARATGGHGKRGGDPAGRTGSDTTLGGAGPGGELAKADGDGDGSITVRDADGTAAGDALGLKGGSERGVYAGEGREGDDGVRGAGAVFGGVIAVPAALKGLVEIGLLIDAGDITGAAGDLFKKGIGKAASIATARRVLAREARVFARQEVKAIAKHMAMDKAFRALAKEERAQLMRIWLWETQRKYFRAYLKAAKAEQRVVSNALKRAKPGDLAALTARDAAAHASEEVATVEPVAGRLPRNHQYAGKEFPRELTPEQFRNKALRFKATGYPDFEPFAKTLPNGKKVVHLEYQGSRTTDFAAANRACGFEETPRGWTWHHDENARDFLLVPTELHEAVSHSGGVAKHRHTTGAQTYGN